MDASVCTYGLGGVARLVSILCVQSLGVPRLEGGEGSCLGGGDELNGNRWRESMVGSRLGALLVSTLLLSSPKMNWLFWGKFVGSEPVVKSKERSKRLELVRAMLAVSGPSKVVAWKISSCQSIVMKLSASIIEQSKTA